MELSRKDYFAAHAPAEIPDWFEGPSQVMPKPPERPKEIADAILQWLSDDGGADLRAFVGDGTLHVVLADNWQVEWAEYQSARSEADQQYVINRYFAWRVFYADRMVEAVK